MKLLRAVEGGGYTPIGSREIKKPDIRIIAATNRDLKEGVEKGQVREDFYYRIHIIPLHLPTLRRQSHFATSHGSAALVAPPRGACAVRHFSCEGRMSHRAFLTKDARKRVKQRMKEFNGGARQFRAPECCPLCAQTSTAPLVPAYRTYLNVLYM